MIALSTKLVRAPFFFLASRAGLVVALAFLLAVQNTYTSTLVASAFLARVGARGIPLYYILFAAVSIPFAALFSSIIDRFARRQLFMGALAVFTGITILLAMLPSMSASLPYVGYLIVRVFEHLLYSIYYILVADYLTVTDNKRYAARIALGMAFGGLTGGGLLTAMTSTTGARMAAWITPVLVVAALAYAGWITKRQQPLDVAGPASPESLAESLRIIPRLLRRYPLIALMSTAMFLNIMLQCIAEFSAFSIYTMHFPRIDQLTVFLGLINAGLSLLGFLVIVLFTGRQLPRLGVPKMNLVYPALDVLTFGILTSAPSLPAGILANVSYDPFEHGVDVPVTTMNYNAIRHRFVGRVRVFIDGIVFPFGLATAGFLLLCFTQMLDLRVIAAFGLILSLVLLALHRNIGKHYIRSLVEMLCDGAVELDQVESGLRLPPQSTGEIHAMLAGDARMALVGLEMAARCAGEVAAEEIAAALTKIPAAQARPILPRLAAASGANGGYKFVERLAEIGPSSVRQLAWEHIASTGRMTAERARPLFADRDEGVRCVAAAASLLDDPGDATACAMLRGNLSSAAAIGSLEVLRHAAGRDISATLMAIGTHSDPGVRAAALAAAESCSADAPGLLDWARRATDDPEPNIRREALSLLTRLAPKDRLGEIADRFFGDASPEVRHAGSEALGALGSAAVPAICRHVHSDREDAQIAAIDALGRALGPSAGERLFDELHESILVPIAFNQRLADSHPDDPALRAALDNAARRALRLVMHALDVLGHRRTLNLVRTMLHSRDERSRANAIESLASLPQRRFVIPILPLIENRGAVDTIGSSVKCAPELIEEALSSPDPWLRAAAAVAEHRQTGEVPTRLIQDPSPIVTETVRQLALRPAGNCPYPEEALMSRLAFLHGVRLFADTGFDDLVAVDRALISRMYLAGEPIIREGEAGDRLCIIHSGTVVVKKGERVLAQFISGDFFGEMALFDDEPRSATVTAIDDVEVLVLERDRFHSLVRQRPGILMEVCATLVRRLRQAEQQALAVAD